MAGSSTERRGGWRGLAAGIGLMVLAGCGEDGQFALFQSGQEQSTGTAARTAAPEMVERDVEAPDVFQVTDMGLWDGRPSLGGVWVAHPDVKEPERVLIRNTANSKSVIGALFRREMSAPGPILQVSSDAAVELGMLAGAPTELDVVALRREKTTVEAPAAADEATEELKPAGVIEETTLDPVAGAAVAIDAAEVAEAARSQSVVVPQTRPQTRPQTEPSAAPQAQAVSVEKPYIQIGIFSLEQNARAASSRLSNAGIVPQVLEQTSQDKTFWRVIVGPVTDTPERTVLLEQIKGLGFADAYPVTN
ncbi:SPOR domain-containing protein [Roseovarius azorensis]|nr:SPOR domain-containing protein [Roseovarius azorensis]